MDVESTAIKVLDLKHRWASCTPEGHLNFNWKCMMAPLTILDYIVVHELAHLIHANHMKGF
jgi:predicted metal-dependent hydrolase